MRVTSAFSGNHYKSGDHYVVCDECGLVYRKSEVKKRWDGGYVCAKDWEPKHPQENVIAWPDRIGVPNARPDTFVTILNDDCSSSTGWTLGTGWTHDTDDDEFNHSTGTAVLDRAVTGLTNGTAYTLQIMTYNRTDGTLTVSLVTATDEAGDTSITVDGQSDITFTAGATADTIRLTPTTDFNGSVQWIGIFKTNSTVTQASL